MRLTVSKHLTAPSIIMSLTSRGGEMNVEVHVVQFKARQDKARQDKASDSNASQTRKHSSIK